MWAPDGESIVFVSPRHAERDDDDASDLGGSPPRAGRRSDSPRRRGRSCCHGVSPDGATIAYLARPGRNAFGRNVRTFAIPAAGGAAVCLTSALDRSCGALPVQPLWSPDGGAAVVAAEDRGDIGLWRVATRSSEAPRRIVAGERALNSFPPRPMAAGWPSRRARAAAPSRGLRLWRGSEARSVS